MSKRSGMQAGNMQAGKMALFRAAPLGVALMALALGLPATAQDSARASKQYDDGGVYEGAFKDGLQHGQGTYRLPSGYEYTGEWVAGEIRGRGVARFPNGSVYEGEFQKGKPEGLPFLCFSSGRRDFAFALSRLLSYGRDGGI